MKKQWYRSSVAKAALIVTEHIMLVVMVLSFIWVTSYPAIRAEILAGKPAKEYENTSSFNDQVLDISMDVLNGIEAKKEVETDGVYDPEKIVDIKEYDATGTISNENASGIAYRLGDLEAWGEEYSDDMGGAEESQDDSIIVCKRADNTYHYYYYREFENLIATEELRFVIVDEASGVTTEQLMESLKNGEFYAGYSDVKGLQSPDDVVEYIDCWNYDGSRLEEKYPTIGGESLLDVANNNPDWNGKLSDAYDMLQWTLEDLTNQLATYNNLTDEYLEGDTNLAYIYVDTAEEKVYTNRKEYADYEKLEENLKDIKGLGKYVVVRPKLADFETNMSGENASFWRDGIKYGGVAKENFIYAVGVDTEYPIQDSFHTEAELYARYGSGARSIAIIGIAASIAFLAILIWLTATAGRSTQDEEIHLNWFDRIKTELAGGIVIGGWCVPVFLIAASVTLSTYRYWDISATEYVYQYNYVREIIPIIIVGGILAAYTCAMFLTGYLSLVRRLKARTVWKNSVLRIVIRFFRKLFRNLNIVWKSIIAFMLFVLVHYAVFLSYGSGVWIPFMLIAEVAAFIYIISQAIGKKRLSDGIHKISAGEVDYKIPLEGLNGKQLEIARQINSIGEGLDAALEESMKSERLKTDLITNVSHDIKTPLTSIINYVDLLKKEQFEDPRIRRYLEVLEAKSQRLKTLTEDVVEASKVSSGNITLEYMNINLVEMIQQTSGEFEEKFNKRRLKEVMTLSDQEAVIRVDGRRMWRVLENIYNNAAKYAMEGTRVYADLLVKETEVEFSLKNVSEQPLNISADELTERFIRGDISRSTEGSGLGLSIAKTLTQMQGGKFELYLDGDLFRVTIVFPLVKQESQEKIDK